MAATLPAQNGGVIRVQGVVEFSQPIIVPVDAIGRMSHFGLIGEKGTGAELRWTGDPQQPAIIARSWHLPNQYRRLSADVCFENFALVGGSMVISGGGKYTKLRGVEIVSCPATMPAALSISDYDDGDIDVNVHDCQCPGIMVDNCHAGDWRATARVCQGTGIAISNSCFDLKFNSEANSGFDLDLNGHTRSLLQCWNEQAWYGAKNPPSICQGRRRDCWGNTFVGMTQAESWNAWDDDELSRVANRDLSDPAQFGLGQIGAQVNGLPLAGKPRNFTAAQVTTDGTNWWVGKNAFLPSSFPPGSPFSILDFSDPTNKLQNVPVNQGDWFVVTGELSSPDWQYLKLQNNWPLIRLTATAAGQQTTLGQNIWIDQQDTIRFVTAPVKIPAAGQGIRLFASLGPNSGGVGPAQDVRFTVANLNVRVVRA